MLALVVAGAIVAGVVAGCAAPGPGMPLKRRGDEIVVCGQLFHTGAPVVLWTDPGGYDAYRTEKRFVPWEKAAYTPPQPGEKADGAATPNRYGLRFGAGGRGPGKTGERLGDEELERFRGGGWDLASLRGVVDQFVIHYDVCGTSRQCFRVLHDMRGLSVHFMLDIDGTIYQTLDVKERAWHAGVANDRSVGIEIANIGAYPVPSGQDPQAGSASGEAHAGATGIEILDRWYGHDADGTRITLPASMGDGDVRTPGFVGRPAREGAIVGTVQGQELVQYDLTVEQYESLVKLTAALCVVLPRIKCDYPRDASGELVREKLSDDQLAVYSGLLGHYHIAKEKIDPGPAFQWDPVVEGARRYMRRQGVDWRAEAGSE
jgi:hypothetical protein